MSNITSTFRGKAVIENSSSPVIYNVSVALANTEVSQVLSSNTKQFAIRVRGSSVLKISFSLGTSGTNFITVPQGCTLSQTMLNFSGTLYFQTTKPAQVVEILEWT